MEFKKKCQVCGLEFISNTGNRKYCKTCAPSVHKIQNAKNYRKNKNKKTDNKKIEWGEKLVENIRLGVYPDVQAYNRNRLRVLFVGGFLKEDITKDLYKMCCYFLRSGIIKGTIDGNIIDFERIG